MRALLVLNPSATTVDRRVRDAIASALRSAVDLQIVATKQRGHALHLVAGAVHEEVDAVFVLGGDGTANEVIQALAGTEVLLGIIPGGGANVLARSLGIPNHAGRATAELLGHLRAGRERRITLGRANERYFAFNAGFGFDAAVVRRVEQHAGLKRALRQLAFVWSASHEWFGAGSRHAAIAVELPDGSVVADVAISLVANTDPYTYLGRHAMRVHPQAAFAHGLDLLTIEPVGTARLLAIIAGTFRNAGHLRSPEVTYLHDLEGFALRSATAQPLMVDGDYAGEHTHVEFRAVRRALRLIA